MRRAERQDPEPSAWPVGPGASALEIGRVVSSVSATLDGTLARKNKKRVQDDLDGTDLSLEAPGGTDVSEPVKDSALNVTAAEPELSEVNPANKSLSTGVAVEESSSVAPTDPIEESVLNIIAGEPELSEPDPANETSAEDKPTSVAPDEDAEHEAENLQAEGSKSTQIKSEDILDEIDSEDAAAEESEELSDDWVPEEDPASESSAAVEDTSDQSAVNETTPEPTTVEEIDAEVDAEAESVEAELRKFEAQERPCQELSVAGIEGYDDTRDCDSNAACRWVGPRPPEAMGLGHCWPVCSAPPNQQRDRCENKGHSACLWVSGASGERCVAATANKTATENDDGAECSLFAPARLGHQRTLEQCASRVLASRQCGGLGRFMFNQDFVARDGDEGNCFCCRGATQSHNATKRGDGWNVFVADVGLDAGDGDGAGWDVFEGSTARDFDEACAELTRAALALGVSNGMVVNVDCAGEAVRVLDVAHQDEGSGVLAAFLLGSAHLHDEARSNFTFELLPERPPQTAQDAGERASSNGIGAELRARFVTLVSERDNGAAVSLEGSLEGTLSFRVNGSELLTFVSRDTDGFFEALEDQLGDSSEDHAINFTEFLALVSETAEDLHPWRGAEARDADLEAFRASLEAHVGQVGSTALGRRLRAIARDGCRARQSEDGGSECWEQLGGRRCDSSACHTAYVWLWHNAQHLLQHWEDASEVRGVGTLPARVRDYAASFFVSRFAERAVDLLNTV